MGTKSKKKAKTRLDAYYRLAKEQGYRARSAFKLIQLNRKYDFLAKSRVVVDLCAAPGGWCQVAAKYMPIGSKIVGVDLVPIVPIRGVKTFVGDITDDKTRKVISAYLKKEPVDCVIHDGAPNVGGVWSRDLFEQNALVLCAAKMACTMLKPGGWFVTKVFRSQDFQKLMWVFKTLFDKVEATKPLASRMESAEIFVVCAGFKAPKQLDSSLFSAQRVFAEVEQEKIMTPSGAMVVPKSNVPQGYDEFATVTHNVASFTEFLSCKDPKEFLKTHHEIRFSTDEDKVYLRSKYTKKELVYLCGDLLQVGEADRRRMIRWREQILKEQSTMLKDDNEVDGDDEEMDVSSLDGEDGGSDNEVLDMDSKEGITKIAQEILELRKRKEKDLKRKQKRLVDRKLKQVKGLINYDPTASTEHLTEEHGFNRHSEMLEDGVEEASDADSLEENEWDISRIAEIDEEQLARLMDKNADLSEENVNLALNPVISANLADEDDYDLGSEEDDDGNQRDNVEEAGQQSLRLVEGEDEDYDVDYYGNYIPSQRSARVKLYEEGVLPAPEDEFDEEDEEAEAQKKKNARKQKDDEDLEEAGKQSKWQRHHLNVSKILDKTFPKAKDGKTSKRKRTALDEDHIEMSSSSALVTKTAKGPAKKSRFDSKAASESDDDDSDSDDGSWGNLSDERFGEDRDDLEVKVGRADSRRKKAIVPDIGKLTTQELVRQQRKQTLKDNKELRKKNKTQRNNKKKDDETLFEEVPVALTDPEVRARTLAIATKMLDKRSRREMLDASINRYTFNDDDDLPDWFIKDEHRNCKVFLPVTAEEIEAQRDRFREMNARPNKKVMEALGRKRRRAQRMLRSLIDKGKADPRMKQKANGLSVRKLMRAQVIKGKDKRKNGPMDSMSFGQRKRERQRLKRGKKK